MQPATAGRRRRRSARRRSPTTVATVLDGERATVTRRPHPPRPDRADRDRFASQLAIDQINGEILADDRRGWSGPGRAGRRRVPRRPTRRSTRSTSAISDRRRGSARTRRSNELDERDALGSRCPCGLAALLEQLGTAERCGRRRRRDATPTRSTSWRDASMDLRADRRAADVETQVGRICELVATISDQLRRVHLGRSGGARAAVHERGRARRRRRRRA